MECPRLREAISARLDAEGLPLETKVLEEHLRTCGACRAYAEAAAELNRRVRVAPAPEVPDLTRSILSALARRQTGRARRWARVALVALGAGKLAAGLSLLLGIDGVELPVHVARELGAWDVALAAGFLWAAWQPLRALGLLPVMAVLTVLTVATSALDVAAGYTRLLAELHHLSEVGGLVVLWWLVRPRLLVRPAASW